MRALAACQHGVVARWQLLALGVAEHVVVHRRRSGQLLPIHRGVYAVGHDRLTTRGRQLAAVLAVGPGAALSHADAGGVHGVRSASGTAVHVTSAGPARRIPGVRVHLTRRLPPEDVVVIDGIPVTSLCRTIVDLSDTATPQALDSILARCELLQLDVGDLEAVTARLRWRRGPGAARLAAACVRLREHGVVITRSEGEELLRRVLAGAGLPAPEMNWLIGADEFDAVWPAFDAGIELDSWRFHRGRHRFVRDRAKLRRAALAGVTMLPYAGEDLVRRPGLIVDEAGRLLAARGGVPSGWVPDSPG